MCMQSSRPVPSKRVSATPLPAPPVCSLMERCSRTRALWRVTHDENYPTKERRLQMIWQLKRINPTAAGVPASQKRNLGKRILSTFHSPRSNITPFVFRMSTPFSRHSVFSLSHHKGTHYLHIVHYRVGKTWGVQGALSYSVYLHVYNATITCLKD